jgi:predicted RNase H-like nuclease
VIAALLGEMLPWIGAALALIAGAIGLFFSGRRSGGVAARQARFSRRSAVFSVASRTRSFRETSAAG